MGSMGERLRAWPALYGAIYPVMLEAAKGSGYALALHGSLGRDLDVIAIPWTEDAIPAEELVDRIGAAIESHWWLGHDGQPHLGPHEHPHGRLVWTIPMHGGAFVDFGVMPLRTQSAKDTKEHIDRLPAPPTGEENEALPGDWWCPECQRALPGSRVTFEERCDTCGTLVRWVPVSPEPATHTGEVEGRWSKITDRDMEELRLVVFAHPGGPIRTNAILTYDRLAALRARGGGA